jgi:hypothetical protein
VKDGAHHGVGDASESTLLKKSRWPLLKREQKKTEQRFRLRERFLTWQVTRAGIRPNSSDELYFEIVKPFRKSVKRCTYSGNWLFSVYVMTCTVPPSPA